MQSVPLFGRGFKGPGNQVNAQKRINLYVRPSPEPEKGASFTLYPRPGLTRVSYVGTEKSRGAAAVNGYVYSVHGSALYRIDAAGTATSIGTIGTNTGHVYFAWSGTQLMFVDGTYGYIYTPSSGTLAQITDADFPANPATVCYFVSRFIVSSEGTAKFYASDLLDGTAWDALNFWTAESETDNVVAVVSDHGALVVMGEYTTEFWAPTGDSTIFTRVGGSGIEWGCVSARTVAKFDTGLVWLARSAMGECRVVKLQGYSPVPLDDVDVTLAINEQRQSQLDINLTTALSYMQDGQYFYQLNFVERSFLYDGFAWSIVNTGTLVDGGPEGSARHLPDLRVQLADQPYVFSYFDGTLYLIDKDALTDAGETIVREVTTRHMFNAGNRVVVWALQVECEVGSAEATEPLMMLQISRDGGMTWGAELWTGMGTVGQYFKRVIWRRLGLARDFVFRLRVTDPVRFSIIGANAVVASE